MSSNNIPPATAGMLAKKAKKGPKSFWGLRGSLFFAQPPKDQDDAKAVPIELSRDVSAEIFSYLTPFDLAKVQGTSSTWAQISKQLLASPACQSAGRFQALKSQLYENSFAYRLLVADPSQLEPTTSTFLPDYSQELFDVRLVLQAPQPLVLPADQALADPALASQGVLLVDYFKTTEAAIRPCLEKPDLFLPLFHNGGVIKETETGDLTTVVEAKQNDNTQQDILGKQADQYFIALLQKARLAQQHQELLKVKTDFLSKSKTRSYDELSDFLEAAIAFNEFLFDIIILNKWVNIASHSLKDMFLLRPIAWLSAKALLILGNILPYKSNSASCRQVIYSQMQTLKAEEVFFLVQHSDRFRGNLFANIEDKHNSSTSKMPNKMVLLLAHDKQMNSALLYSAAVISKLNDAELVEILTLGISQGYRTDNPSLTARMTDTLRFALIEELGRKMASIEPKLPYRFLRPFCWGKSSDRVQSKRFLAHAKAGLEDQMQLKQHPNGATILQAKAIPYQEKIEEFKQGVAKSAQEVKELEQGAAERKAELNEQKITTDPKISALEAQLKALRSASLPASYEEKIGEAEQVLKKFKEGEEKQQREKLKQEIKKVEEEVETHKAKLAEENALAGSQIAILQARASHLAAEPVSSDHSASRLESMLNLALHPL